MRKLTLLLMIALMITCTAAKSDEWNGYHSGTITNGPAILFQSAHSSSIPITRLQNGTPLILFDTYGSWYFVREANTGVQGWLPRENFKISDFYANDPLYGIVLCQSLTVRETPDTSGKKIISLHTQDSVSILREQNGWYYIQPAYPNHEVAGWVLKDFVTTDFAVHYIQNTSIAAYAAPSLSAKKVALLDIDTPLYIIDTFNDFWVVSLRGASAFVSMRDLNIQY